VKRSLVAIVLCLFLVAGCGSDSSSTSSTAAETAEEQAPEAASKTKPKVTVPSGAPPKKLVIEDLEEGSGPAAKAGDEVTVQYVGVDYKTGKQFDASWDRGEPFSFSATAKSSPAGTRASKG
jgi:peptidylprolyl isomerase